MGAPRLMPHSAYTTLRATGSPTTCASSSPAASTVSPDERHRSASPRRRWGPRARNRSSGGGTAARRRRRGTARRRRGAPRRAPVAGARAAARGWDGIGTSVVQKVAKRAWRRSSRVRSARREAHDRAVGGGEARVVGDVAQHRRRAHAGRRLSCDGAVRRQLGRAPARSRRRGRRRPPDGRGSSAPGRRTTTSGAAGGRTVTALPRTRSTRIRTVSLPCASCPTASPVTVTSARISPRPRCAMTTLRSKARLRRQGWVTRGRKYLALAGSWFNGSVNARSRLTNRRCCGTRRRRGRPPRRRSSRRAGSASARSPRPPAWAGAR